jgi:hypothetical protein
MPCTVLTQLSNLRLLDLQRNNFEGTLPEDWSKVPNLVYLTLENNHLSGESQITRLQARP